MLKNLSTKQLIRLLKMRLSRSYYLENSLEKWFKKETNIYVKTENSYWIVRKQVSKIQRELYRRKSL